VPYASKEFCEKFINDLKQAPNKVKEQLEQAKDSPMFKQFTEGMKEAEEVVTQALKEDL
jgi:hypothetical protein